MRAAEAGEEAAARALLASRAAAGRTPAQRLGLLGRRGFSAEAAESVLGVLGAGRSRPQVAGAIQVVKASLGTLVAVARERPRGDPRAMIASVASSEAQTTATMA